MTYFNALLLAGLMAAGISLGGCSDAAQSLSSGEAGAGISSFEPGETRIYTFPSEQTLMVSFSHEGSADTALACQGERADPMAFPLPNCAGVYESDGVGIIEGGTYAEGLHGAGVTFQPVDGEVVVAVRNISKIRLELSVEAEPAS